MTSAEISDLYTIGPEEPEYGGPGEIVTVMTRIDSQRPFAYLFRDEGSDQWELLSNGDWNIMINLKYLLGNLYDQWQDALPELESAFNGPCDLNAGRYLELADIYDRTADLLDGNKWTQYANARDKEGRKINYNSPDADKYCLTGAMAKVDRHGLYINLMPMMRYLDIDIVDVPAGSILSSRLDLLTAWNDMPDRTEAEVIAALRETAETLRQAHSEGRDYFVDFNARPILHEA